MRHFVLLCTFALTVAAAPHIFNPFEVECDRHRQPWNRRSPPLWVTVLVGQLRMTCSPTGKLFLLEEPYQPEKLALYKGYRPLECRCVLRDLYDGQRKTLEDGAEDWIIHNIAQRVPGVRADLPTTLHELELLSLGG